MKQLILRSTVLALSSSLLLSACNSSSSSSKHHTPDLTDAVVSTKGPGDASFTIIDSKNLEVKSQNLVTTGATDYEISAYGKYFYHIGTYQLDKVTKYAIDNPQQAIWSYSTIDNVDDPTSNPYSLVFVNEEKAYLIRYDSNELWVVNPSAETEAEFKIKEIDLSAYATDTDLPGMSSGVVVDGKLYLTLQRLVFWDAAENSSYLAVIDTETDEEIDTAINPNFKGVPLQTANPLHVTYHNDLGLIVQSVGKYCYDAEWNETVCTEKIGGIEKINLSDYSSEVLVKESITGHKPNHLAIVNSTKAYFSSYNSWGNLDLCVFDPSIGDASVDCTAIYNSKHPISGLSLDSAKRLWVSIANMNNPRIEIFNTDDNSQIKTLYLDYNPETVLIPHLTDGFK